MLCDIISAKVILDSTDKGNQERDGQIIRYFIDSLLSFLLFNTTSGAIRMTSNEKDEIALHDNKTTSDIHICGIFVFCNALHLIEMQSNPTEYNTHPPSEIRKEYFCQTIMNLTSGLQAMSITDVIIEGMLRQYLKFIDYLDEKNISVTQNKYKQIQHILYYEYEIKEYEI